MSRTNGPGKIFVVSAPSGAGKTTLCRLVRKRLPNLVYSVSCTTRPMRQGEVPGRDYHFVTREVFEEGIRNQRWAEWAKVYGNYYGTDGDFLRRSVEDGCFVLLDIDVQGARQIVARFPDSVTVFVMPPSVEELERRLRGRGADAPEVMERRLAEARSEMEARHLYLHQIVNDRLEDAAEKLYRIITDHGEPKPCPERRVNE
ncbi:MAG: guanylate kinase [Proteobacteria bacterium]|nr:guanylate kinase [Pseudomonadota bacterium]